MSRELFGTDGVRAKAGEYPLDETGVRSIGRAVGAHFAQPGQEIVMGWDTRESSPRIVKDLIAGLNSVGVNVVKAGVLPTPGLAYVTREGKSVAGIMVTASHNPYQYNGIKVFDAQGGKLPDETEEILNKLIIEGVTDRESGTSREDQSLIKAYEDFLVSSGQGLRLTDVKLAIDSANGAASGLAARVYSRLGATVVPLFDQPDGRNINDHCGATDTAVLANIVRQENLNVGIALDGDADRIIMIDEHGREAKGDYLMYILAVSRGLKGVVATTMSNLGFELALKDKAIRLARVDVGDRYVLDGLKQTGYKLGGEQSGHIILPELLMTGDALLAGVQVLGSVCQSDKTLAQWCDEVELLPQAIVNIPLDDKSKLTLPVVKTFLEEQQAAFAGQGRLIVRPSGTEPVARVMVEADNAQAEAERIASRLEALLRRGNE